MFKITYKQQLNDEVVMMKFLAPRIVKARKAGQFIIVQVDENGERFPLTIADADEETGVVTIVFQVLGKSTRKLAALTVNDEILNVLGPLGKPTTISLKGKVVVIGGGVGIAPILPITKALKSIGNHITAILGGRNSKNIILSEEFKSCADKLIIVTDDGSQGIKGNVLSPLNTLIQKDQVDQVVAVGPLPMMKAVCDYTRETKTETLVSLNPIMVDGTGMCGGCRVNIDGQVKFACVDGPEFNGHSVDFDSLMTRNRHYNKERKGDSNGCKAISE